MVPIRFLCFLLILLAGPGLARAQEPASSPAPAAPLTLEQQQHVILLRGKLERRGKAAEELTAVRKLLAEDPAPEEKSRLEEREKSLSKEFESFDAELRREMSGVTEVSTSAEGGEIDLQKQAKEVLKPALDFLNDMMKQPREMEEVRRNIEWRTKQMTILDRAIDGLNKTLREIDADTERAANGALRAELESQRTDYERRRTVYKNELAVLEPRLSELKKERQGFGQYAAKLWSGFVLLRLFNLLLAVASFAGVLFLLRWVRRWLSRRGLRTRLKTSPFLARATDVLFHTLSVIAAVFAAFVILWISGDWLLLTLAMLLVAGLILVSRHTLPRMYEQARILLNLGGVREGERVMWRGLPWLVKRLHFQSHLYNPALTGGLMRLPLRDMAALLSRHFGHKERWFPTEEGDWVVLNDGTIGKVVLQTPEFVQLVPVGGSFKTYATTDFLLRTPRNLSHNFRVESKFSLDYRHTEAVLKDAPELLAAHLREGYLRLIPAEEVIHVSVEMQAATNPSIDLLVMADFTGKAASYYESLQRLTQRLCLETAAAHGWKVAFAQVVVHQADGLPNNGARA